MILTSECSDFVNVEPGFATAFLFLVYINDLHIGVMSTFRLSADNTLCPNETMNPNEMGNEVRDGVSPHEGLCHVHHKSRKTLESSYHHHGHTLRTETGAMPYE